MQKKKKKFQGHAANTNFTGAFAWFWMCRGYLLKKKIPCIIRKAASRGHFTCKRRRWIQVLTPHEELFSSRFFNLSTLHLIFTSWPTLKQSEENGRKPTATHGSSMGRCNVSALLKSSSSDSPDSTGTGACAPVDLSPKIPYLMFSILSVCTTSSWPVWINIC